MAAKRKANINRVAVLATAAGEPLIIRGDPSEEAVLEFVRAHHGRFLVNGVGGPAGMPARQIVGAAYYENEADLADFSTEGTEIDLSPAFETVETAESAA